MSISLSQQITLRINRLDCRLYHLAEGPLEESDTVGRYGRLCYKKLLQITRQWPSVEIGLQLNELDDLDEFMKPWLWVERYRKKQESESQTEIPPPYEEVGPPTNEEIADPPDYESSMVHRSMEVMKAKLEENEQAKRKRSRWRIWD